MIKKTSVCRTGVDGASRVHLLACAWRQTGRQTDIDTPLCRDIFFVCTFLFFALLCVQSTAVVTAYYILYHLLTKP